MQSRVQFLQCLLPKMSSVAAVLCLSLGAPVLPASEQGEIARGGRLYDKWYKVAGADTPEARHVLYPADSKYAKRPGANWRCKECHGWDYKGKDGLYSKGKHNTGIIGIKGSAGADPAKIAALLKDDKHGYDGKMGDADINALALFVSKGQVDMDDYIDPATKAVKGDSVKGIDYYETICVNCHGKDGKLIEDMNPLGYLARKNPWEILHKIRNGQPIEEMPALRALDIQVAVDILRYTQDLPD